jgi:magnesium transporter
MSRAMSRAMSPTIAPQQRFNPAGACKSGKPHRPCLPAMITAWIATEKGLARHEGPIGAQQLPAGTVWLDLVDISREEELQIEGMLQIDIPSRVEMQGIEVSNRLYREGQALFMTATHLIKTETESPETSPVTFILCPNQLVTLRYAEPWSFRVFIQRAPKSGATNAELAFVGLMETTVERLADMLELVTIEMEHLSRQIFSRHAAEVDLQKVIFKLGACGNIASKARESLLDKNRVMIFADGAAEWLHGDSRARLKASIRDIASLSDHATFISGKVSFQLDATLGLINIEQNRIIKIFSIAAVVFMPPTMIASIYGMNFENIHEYHWSWGYEYGLGLMVLSVIGTLACFRWRRWL